MENLKEMKILSIEEEEYDDYVYTITVENNHNYFINKGTLSKNCVVIVDELQNLSKTELRTLTSRCGENVKFIATGDLNQIDNHHLSKENNALNWIVKAFQGDKRYGHLKMSGKRARGPICEMTNEHFSK